MYYTPTSSMSKAYSAAKLDGDGKCVQRATKALQNVNFLRLDDL